MWLNTDEVKQGISSCCLCLFATFLCLVSTDDVTSLISWKVSIYIKTSSETGDIVHKNRDTKCSLVMKKWSNHRPTLTCFWNHSQQRTIRWIENNIEQNFPAKWLFFLSLFKKKTFPSHYYITCWPPALLMNWALHSLIKNFTKQRCNHKLVHDVTFYVWVSRVNLASML